MARGQASVLAEHGSIVRLNPKDLSQSTATRDSQRVAGFASLAGSAAELDASALATLVQWLGARDGFNDRVVRRCARGTMIGIVATRRLPNSQEDRTELALDFTCNSLVVVRDQAGRRTETSAFFDASRTSALELARRLLPHDQELSHLR
jgi:hypothetical protein